MASLSRCVRLFRSSGITHVKRHYAATQNLDPIQKLFLDKIQEYKKMTASGKIPGFNEKELQEQLDRVASTYGADKEDFSKFPVFNFSEPAIELVDYEGAPQDDVDEEIRKYEEENWKRMVGSSEVHMIPKDIWEKEYKPKYQKAGYFDKAKFL